MIEFVSRLDRIAMEIHEIHEVKNKNRTLPAKQNYINTKQSVVAFANHD